MKKEHMKVESVEVLAPETNTTSVTPAEVSTQYHMAVAGCLEMVRFGAMMMDVSTSLTRETRHGCIQSGDTLKGWLEENCPDVNYKTALRFLSLAEGVKRACGIPSATPLRLVLPGPGGEMDLPVEFEHEGPGRRVGPARLRALRKDVWELVEGKSARQLLFQFMSPDGPTGGARPASTKKLDPDWQHTDAELLWSEHIGWMVKDLRQAKCYLNLNAAELKVALDNLALVRDALKSAMGK